MTRRGRVLIVALGGDFLVHVLAALVAPVGPNFPEVTCGPCGGVSLGLVQP